MIAKHVPAKGTAKSSFSKLVKYMIAPLAKNERVGTVTVTNCQSDDAKMAILEVLNTQSQNTRAKGDKTYHLIISFRAGEEPDAAVLKAIEDRICVVLGYDGHQRVSAVHHDTDHLHVHIAINKIHPTRYRLHEPFNAYFALGRTCTEMEAEFGLESDNHVASKSPGENLAADMEHNTKVDSLIGWIRRECAGSLREARSWADLHAVLNENGLSIKQRGNGMVIAADNGVVIKASSVGREFSQAALEARLGNFVEAPSTLAGSSTRKNYAKQPTPTNVDTSELFLRYTRFLEQRVNSRRSDYAAVLEIKRRHIDSAKRSARLKRIAAKTLTEPGIARKVLYGAIHKSLLDELDAIHRDCRMQRQEISKKARRLSWVDWLRAEAQGGDTDALGALRNRDPSKGGKGFASSERQRSSEAGSSKDGVTRNGTVIYTVGQCAIRDDGQRLQVSRGSDQVGLEAAIRMAVERYGGLISVNGSTAFKEQIAAAAAAAKLEVCFDDQALELRRQQLIAIYFGKENRHERHNRKPGKSNQRSDGRARRAAAAAAGRSGARTKPDSGDKLHAQRHAGKAGQAPPPQSRNGVRELSELGVVHVTKGGEVLLPGDVPHNMEHKGSEPPHQLRRGFHRPRLLTPSSSPTTGDADKPGIAPLGTAPPPTSRDQLAPLSSLKSIVMERQESSTVTQASPAPKARPSPVEQYVFEREQKRLRAFDIPKHSQYRFTNSGEFSYAGLRNIDGQALALLLKEGEISVLAVDQATAKRLRRMSIGDRLIVSAAGVIKSKGRGR